MAITIRPYTPEDLPEMLDIWNHVVADGQAFPQENLLTLPQAAEFFASQTYTGVADENGDVIGLYILHPNNVGRCSHIANTSYAVQQGQRGKHIGERLVRDSMAMAKKAGFRLLQFNAVVANNKAAIHLYNKLGFVQLGTIPKGFRLKNGTLEDIVLFYIELPA